MGLTLTFVLWAGSVAGGIVWQERYANTPGTPAVAPMRWPAATTLPLVQDQFNLLVFIHPNCPCSRATLSELARIVSAAGRRLSVRVLVLQYGPSSQSTNSPLYQQARAIPGVDTLVDPDGVLARHFQAACSGQALLYDRGGQLVFSGGITGARGHEGGNDGESAVLRLVGATSAAHPTSTTRPLAASTDVYGCLLFGNMKEPTCHH